MHMMKQGKNGFQLLFIQKSSELFTIENGTVSILVNELGVMRGCQ